MAGIESWTAEEYLNIRCSLGEGPYYVVGSNKLRFVDIKKGRLHDVDLGVGPQSVRTFELGQPVGVTANIEGVDPERKILIGGKKALATFEFETGKLEELTPLYQGKGAEWDDRMRSNDGAVDSKGRMWLGTMNDFHVGSVNPDGMVTFLTGYSQSGSILRIGSDLKAHNMEYPVVIPNSIGWSLDNKTLYFTHSTERIIYTYDFDAPTGTISNKRPFYTHDGPGEPDGCKIDVEGNLWQCVYGEGCCLKISPAGKLVGKISLPTRNVTCPAFVGEDLYITSAAEEDPERYPESARFGGALFKVHVGVKGVGEHKFKLKN